MRAPRGGDRGPHAAGSRAYRARLFRRPRLRVRGCPRTAARRARPGRRPAPIRAPRSGRPTTGAWGYLQIAGWSRAGRRHDETPSPGRLAAMRRGSRSGDDVPETARALASRLRCIRRSAPSREPASEPGLVLPGPRVDADGVALVDEEWHLDDEAGLGGRRLACALRRVAGEARLG